MSRNLLALAVGFFLSCLTLSAQPVLTVSGESAAPGESVDLNVTVDGYTDYISLQFSINWDPEVAGFVEVSNLTTGLPGFSEVSSINVNPGNGVITVSWFEASITPTSLPNGTNLFTITFNAVGDECDSTAVKITNTPLAIEIADADEEVAETQVVDGYVSIPGTNCVTETLTITGSQEIAANGSEVCVQFTSQNFTGIAAAQFTLNFNPAVLSYSSIQNINWPGVTEGGNFGTTMTSNGVITFVWFDQNAVGVDIPDGTVLFEVCFDVIGNGGQMSQVSFGNDPRPIEFSNADGQEVEFQGNPGKVTVEGMIEGFALLPEQDVTGAPGEIVCVDINVNDFIDIVSMQFSINWDSSVLKFDHVEGFNLPDFSEANVAGPDAPLLRPGQASVLWFDQTVQGVSLENGESIFSICFEIVGECDESSTVEITSIPLPIEVSNETEVLEVSTIPGSVNVMCGGCGFTFEITHPSCPGDTDGAININVFGCMPPVTFAWSNGATTEDLIDIGEGDYMVTITTGSGILVSDTLRVRDPEALSASANVTDSENGDDGAVDLTVSGGNTPYTYMWSNGATTQDISGLAPGMYTVTITDGNGCTLIAGPFNVRDGSAIAGTVTDVACFGESTGSIDITSVNCGPEPYTYEWSNGANTQDIADLPAGTYSVTVTSGDGSTCETSFNVQQAESPIEVQVDTMNETSAGMDGAIALTVSGGLGPYSYLWSNGATTKDISGLSSGSYSVTITDQFGCEVIEVIVITGLGLFVSVEVSDYNGFGASCFGECDALMVAMAVNAIGPVTYEWSNGTTGSINAEACAGIHTVTVTDQLGQTAETTVEITEPPALVVDIDVTCASEPTTADGSAIASVSGGIPPYSFQWNTGETSSSISNKQPGPLVLIVTDDNGCQNMQQSEICISGIDCYEAMTVITPNGDGKNDQFRIQCIYEFANRLTIYNRYGGMEFRMDNYDNSWEGTDQDGNQLSDGGYLWVLEVFLDNGDSRVYKGTVALVRSLD